MGTFLKIYIILFHLVTAFSCREMAREVAKIANCMKEYGVKRGDVVTIYMPMIPEIAFVMLACARIGAIHSVVFAGFSEDSLKDRIVDGHSKWVFTADEGKRGGKGVILKETVDKAIEKAPVGLVKNVFIFKRTGKAVPVTAERDIWMDEALPKMRPYCPAGMFALVLFLIILFAFL